MVPSPQILKSTGGSISDPWVYSGPEWLFDLIWWGSPSFFSTELVTWEALSEIPLREGNLLPLIVQHMNWMMKPPKSTWKIKGEMSLAVCQGSRREQKCMWPSSASVLQLFKILNCDHRALCSPAGKTRKTRKNSKAGSLSKVKTVKTAQAHQLKKGIKAVNSTNFSVVRTFTVFCTWSPYWKGINDKAIPEFLQGKKQLPWTHLKSKFWTCCELSPALYTDQALPQGSKFSVHYLLGSVEQLLGHSCGHDGPAGGCTGLQEQREPGHQLHPQVCDGHFVIQHCHCLLCQDGVRQRRQNLWRNTEEST